MKTEAKITIRGIRAALDADVALGHISQATAIQVADLLALDWKEKQHNDRMDMDCFLEDLHELFKSYDAKLSFKGHYEGEIYVNGFYIRLGFGGPAYFDTDFIALLPKMWKRSEIFAKLHFPETSTIDEIRPIYEAVRKVDRKSVSYITDKQFNEMIKPYT